jgi:hypothetical protein
MFGLRSPRDRAGNRYRGAAAIRYLTHRLRRLWWLAPQRR